MHTTVLHLLPYNTNKECGVCVKQLLQSSCYTELKKTANFLIEMKYLLSIPFSGGSASIFIYSSTRHLKVRIYFSLLQLTRLRIRYKDVMLVSFC